MFLPVAWQVLHVLLSLLENFAPWYDWHIWHFAFFSSSVNCSVKKKNLDTSVVCMLRLCVLSEVSKEFLMCHQNVVQDISPFAWSINLTLWWAGRSFHFLYFNVSQMTVNDICGLFMPWTFKLKTNDIFYCSFCYLRNHLGSVQKCIIWILKVLEAS